jgi:hypothetical protein
MHKPEIHVPGLPAALLDPTLGEVEKRVVTGAIALGQHPERLEDGNQMIIFVEYFERWFA